MFLPIIILTWTAILLSQNRKVIKQDIERLHYYSFLNFSRSIVLNRSFRNIIYYRLGDLSVLSKLFLKPNLTLHIFTKDIGPGLLIAHGDATYINAKK